MKEILDRISGLNVLVVGDIILDSYVWGDATRISPEAPVPVVEVRSEDDRAGGAANVAANVRALGASVELCGCVGTDDHGRRLLRILKKAGIGFRRDVFTADVPTIRKTRIIVQHQQLCRLDSESEPQVYAAGRTGRLSAVLKAIRSCDAVIITDYAKGFLDNEAIERITAAGRKAGKLVALDPKPRASLKFRNQHVITPNRKESLQLAGIEITKHDVFPAEAVCKAIWNKCRPDYLVVTLGQDGMLLSEKGKIIEQIPTVAREVFDVSGAGDTVIAALATAMAAGFSLARSARFANTAAGVVIGKLGTATASPEEIVAHEST